MGLVTKRGSGRKIKMPGDEPLEERLKKGTDDKENLEELKERTKRKVDTYKNFLENLEITDPYEATKQILKEREKLLPSNLPFFLETSKILIAKFLQEESVRKTEQTKIREIFAARIMQEKVLYDKHYTKREWDKIKDDVKKRVRDLILENPSYKKLSRIYGEDFDSMFHSLLNDSLNMIDYKVPWYKTATKIIAGAVGSGALIALFTFLYFAMSKKDIPRTWQERILRDFAANPYEIVEEHHKENTGVIVYKLENGREIWTFADVANPGDKIKLDLRGLTDSNVKKEAGRIIVTVEPRQIIKLNNEKNNMNLKKKVLENLTEEKTVELFRKAKEKLESRDVRGAANIIDMLLASLDKNTQLFEKIKSYKSNILEPALKKLGEEAEKIRDYMTQFNEIKYLTNHESKFKEADKKYKQLIRRIEREKREFLFADVSEILKKVKDFYSQRIKKPLEKLLKHEKQFGEIKKEIESAFIFRYVPYPCSNNAGFLICKVKEFKSSYLKLKRILKIIESEFPRFAKYAITPYFARNLEKTINFIMEQEITLEKLKRKYETIRKEFQCKKNFVNALFSCKSFLEELESKFMAHKIFWRRSWGYLGRYRNRGYLGIGFDVYYKFAGKRGVYCVVFPEIEAQYKQLISKTKQLLKEITKHVKNKNQ